MSQAGPLDSNKKEAFGAGSKVKYEPYSEEELASVEYFWNQMRTIVLMKDYEYLCHFWRMHSDYIERHAGI